MTCQQCGLPEELCICEDIEKTRETIELDKEERTHGKEVTILRGFGGDINVESLESELKKKCACGGTSNDDSIELQGEHKERARKELEERGYEVELVS